MIELSCPRFSHAHVSLKCQTVISPRSPVLCRRQRRGKRPRRPNPIARALVRIGVQRNVGDDGRAVRSGFKDSGDPRERDPADRNEGYLADFHLPFRYAGQALRCESHGFQDRRIDRPKRDVIRADLASTRELGFVMGRDAEFYPSAADRTKIRGREIALAEMDEVAAGVDCMLPIIIDDEFCALARAKRFCPYNLLADCGVRLVLDPQLHEPDAARQEPRDPSRAVDDQIERIKHARDR
jgi:hypothetical protein